MRIAQLLRNQSTLVIPCQMVIKRLQPFVILLRVLNTSKVMKYFHIMIVVYTRNETAILDHL